MLDVFTEESLGALAVVGMARVVWQPVQIMKVPDAIVLELLDLNNNDQ